MSEQNRNYEQIEEITLHFGKGTVEPFTAKDGRERIWSRNTIFRNFDPAGSECCPIHMKQAEKPSHIDKQGNSE